ncbi:glycoside hydrolase domain-containing protein [Clostridium tarantellae]|uniref:DUF4091 domain-containing protein n=1 Tax=Clostridium tarantellae TaxID=39493 RepID=A0A6I1MMV2_9CLOT|nr:glycoside hydrolase domain-containing protein [Clostridium tarantellae]MPQ44093.1 DUF4091 domain-containing protein [Clostridium tarantellae]
MKVKQNKYALGQSMIAEVIEGIEELKLNLKLTVNENKLNIGAIISGFIVDENNNPIKQAVIKLVDSNFEPLTHVYTDDKGKYSIDTIFQSEIYNLIITSEGKLPAKSEVFSLNNEEKKILNFKLFNDTSNILGAISGVVKDNTKFISGAVISLYSILNNEKTLIAITYTNNNGEFLFNKISSGNYIMRISSLGYLSKELSAKVKAGQVLDTNIILAYEENSSNAIISGVITDDNNNEISNASVILYNVDVEKKIIIPIAFSKTNSSGVYTFINVPKGNYMVKSNKWQLINEFSTVTVPSTSINENIVLSKLEGFFASNNKHYLKENYNNIITESSNKNLNLVCWKGEKISTEIILWTDVESVNNIKVQSSLFSDKDGNAIYSNNINFNFLKYVKAAGKMIPDILDNVINLNIERKSIQPVWITIEIPENVKSGIYSGVFTFISDNSKPLNFKVNIEVLNINLPSYDKWSFHLDLWQNPFALARYYKVTPWSKEHLNYLRPHLKMLRKAGQKVITTTIIKDPWNSQTYDAYDTMILCKKQANGTFKYDFTSFDTYVSLCLEIGIDKQINCYSMVPWKNRVFYFDEVLGKEVEEFLTPGTSEWINFWKQFIDALVEHVKSKGWIDKTYIAMDERHINDMKAVINLLRNTPLKISGAMNYANVTDIVNSINDISMAIWEIRDDFYNVVENRHKLGFNTTYYVCTGAFPNTFTYSNPGEAAWLGWYVAKFNADGFLRWAYDSWVEKPLETTDFIRFESGDCFLVYPEVKSSVRFERLIEGIQDNEKIRYIMKNYNNWSFEIEKIVRTLKGGSNIKDINYGDEVVKVRNQLNNIARRIANGEVISNATNIALNKVATASSSEASYGRGPEKGNDGNLNTRWCAKTGSSNEWWQVDLAESYNINAIEIYWEKSAEYGFIIQVSLDQINWRTIFDNTANISKENVIYININENSVRYVKLQMKSLPPSGVYASFYEFRVLGSKS